MMLTGWDERKTTFPREELLKAGGFFFVAETKGAKIFLIFVSFDVATN